MEFIQIWEFPCHVCPAHGRVFDVRLFLSLEMAPADLFA